ncbi:hypothetical protein HBA54_10615 [Pelagibius litoralis]|uniref:Uncharacterized protein n=1 Tax=Pelagibius litoralis TaxID=374515 RepID=A0A967CCF5_9PROT|nr:hypothetical protein [Pelagibius litoralis]NIA69043.1 hypothetical protein [Pelagibius litoralis]
MRLRNGVLGMALLGLSACAELGIQFPLMREPAPEVGPAPVDEALSDVGRFPVEAEEEKVVELKPPPPIPKRKPEVTQAAIDATRDPQADPDSLVGLDFERTSALLGDPALLIEEPPAKIWAYNGSNCVLHIFFYPKVGGSDFRVLTYKVKGGAEGETDGETVPDDFARLCLSELLAQAEAERGEPGNDPVPPADGAAGGS